MTILEIIDENGNIHGPFASRDEAMKHASDFGLGDQRHQDGDERSPGWYFRMTKTAR